MKTDYQRFLFPYAYNILGSIDNALDAVQNVLLKYISLSEKKEIKDERNYLIRSVINEAINIKNHNKRYIQIDDIWLPEPIATEHADQEVYLQDILSYSLLVLLERLNAQERAVFILRESFDYSHKEIADVLGINIENSRKLLSRSKTKLYKMGRDIDRPIGSERKEVSPQLDHYIEAIRSRSIARIEKLLRDDIVFYADGGTKMKVVKKTCIGAADVSNLLIFVYENFQIHYRITIGEVNHQPALWYYEGNDLKSCQVFELSSQDGKIIQINSIIDPDKLNKMLLM